MKIFYLFVLLFILFLTFQSSAQDLPKGLTEFERELMKNYRPPISLEGFTNPPSVPVRTMAEWEELQGIIITWTSQTTILRQIVDYAQDECKVFIVCSDSNTVKSALTSNGIPLTNVYFLVASYNSIWVRDYGPWAVYANGADSLLLVDWIYNRPRPLDDQVPAAFANRYSIPLYQTTVSPYDFVATGGNFMADGHGTAFSSRLIVTENPTKTEAEIDTIVKRFMGIDRYVKMTVLPYDGIHHIDMHIKLLDEETLLVGQYPPGVADGPQIELNLQYVLNNFKTVYGKDFKVVRIPMPPDGQGRYPNAGGQYRTYTNSVFINKTIIVPTYELQYDTTALRIYREAMPGYRVVGINCNSIIGQSGAIHCITKEIGVDEPIYINVFPLTQTSQTGFNAKTVIKTRSGVANARLLWSSTAAGPFNEATLSGMVQDTFYASFSVLLETDTIFYYISAVSNSGRLVTKPLVAPFGYLKHPVDPLLPVALVSFGGVVSGENIVLSWATGSETNNRGFEIERKSDKGFWQTIGFISGAGNSALTQHYNFTDRDQAAGVHFYRLKQIDFNGVYTYSAESEILYTGTFSFVLEQNYPNPFNPETAIKFTLNKQDAVRLEVFNVFGEHVATLAAGVLEAGTHEVRFKADAAASGIYYYKLFTPGNQAVRKMMYLK